METHLRFYSYSFHITNLDHRLPWSLFFGSFWQGPCPVWLLSALELKNICFRTISKEPNIRVQLSKFYKLVPSWSFSKEQDYKRENRCLKANIQKGVLYEVIFFIIYLHWKGVTCTRSSDWKEKNLTSHLIQGIESDFLPHFDFHIFSVRMSPSLTH